MPQPWPAVSPRPDEADVAALRRRRAKAADDRLAARLAGIEILEDHAHEHVAFGRQAGEIDACSQIADVERVRTAQHGSFREVLVARPLDEHARRLVGATPDDRAIADDVADLQAPRRHRPQRIGRDDGRRLARIKNAAETGQRDGAGECVLDETTTACLHGILLETLRRASPARCHAGEGAHEDFVMHCASLA